MNRKTSRGGAEAEDVCQEHQRRDGGELEAHVLDTVPVDVGVCGSAIASSVGH